MSLRLADVKDTDCLRSQSPLVLGRMPGRYVTGAAAILRRVLYAWALPQVLVYDETFGEGLLLYEGITLGPGQILGLRRSLERAAEAEDFVLAAQVPVALDGNTLSIPGTIRLVDGRAYPLEVSIFQAGAALRAIGA